MVALRVGAQYENDRARFAEYIHRHQKKIAKAVDLFSRIKSTGQAEKVMTVLYASRELKQAQSTRELDEQQLYDYILDWKKSWNNDEKRQALANAIRNLVLLGWLRVRISESLSEAA